MSNYFKDNEDLQYYFERGVDWTPLIGVTEYDWKGQSDFEDATEAKAFYRDILEMVGGFVASEVAPHSAAIDAKGVHLEDGEAVSPPELDAIFEQLKGLELYGLCVPRELGGMNCPLLVYLFTLEMFGRADVSVMAHYGFHSGVAMALLVMSMHEGTTAFDADAMQIGDTRFRKAIDEVVAGEAWGCMDITEPDAGSDMAKLKASAEQDEDGNWFLTGQKIFITSGHGKYHFVIARTEKVTDVDNPLAGLAGLSMFLVSTYEEDEEGNRTRIVSLDRVEEKLGHHGSVTAALTFDRAPAHLIGKRGEGFKYMLMLMNNARLNVGFEALGLCESAYRMARDYAAERPSMGKTIDKHEMIADYLDEMRTDIQGIRAIAMKGAWAEEMATKLQLKLERMPPSDPMEKKRIERQVRQLKADARRITPLLKYVGSERAVDMARCCVQIHGGNGYMKEYGAEKLLRDSLVLPIYEGTSQIQALMAMKDTLGGIMKNPQAFVKRQAQTRWRSLSAKDPLERRLAKLQLLSMGAQQHLMARTAANKFRSLQDRPLNTWPKEFLKNWDPKRDFAFAMLHAERLTKLLADELISEVLFEQARRHPERRPILERYLERAEPRCRFMHDEITTTGGRLLRELMGNPEAAQEAG